ncbi:hypothetical protein [Pelagibacterium sediminicola]|uniref:hypothetical protein n=1 Tax=Pelagibacterium sediminicola TaxID=2248761 RepID=UPI000E30B9F4|nr:hypothetical protein [Pelagibacterium sediminicola]
MRIFLALAIFSTLATGAFAQELSPEGTWADDWGTTLEISYCGDDGTQVCAILLDVQGDSRTEANLAYVDQQIMQAGLVAENQWKGTVVFEGNEAEGTLTQTGPDTIEIQGCRMLILCETLAFRRV